MSLDPPGTVLAPAEAAPRDRLGRSAGLAGAATLTSRILGLVREQVLAGVFGAGNEMDSYLVALRIPSLVRDLLAEGAMSASFVPTFTRYLSQRGKAEAWRLGNNVINALLLTTGAIVITGTIVAPLLVPIYAPEFAEIPGKTALTVSLGRWLLPYLTLAALTAACMGMLNSLRHYFVPALAPATFNVSTIACLLLLLPVMPRLGLPPVYVLAIGTLVGGMMQLAIQWPALRNEGFRYQRVLDLRDPGLRQILMLMGPGTLGIAATQINLFVTTQLATYQGVGAVSWLQYAFRLIYLPVGLFGVSIATAVLPSVSRHAASGDRASMAATIARGLGLMLVVNVPATVGLIALAHDIVQLVFERGRFLPSDTIATAAALRYYALGLVGYAAVRISAPVFYAIGRSRVPVVVSTSTIVVNLLLAPLLVRAQGFTGLAMSTAFCSLFNASVLLAILTRELGHTHFSQLKGTLVKTTVAATAMGLGVIITLQLLHTLLPGPGLVSQVLRVGGSIGAGVATLVLAGSLLGISEVASALNQLGQRLGFVKG